MHASENGQAVKDPSEGIVKMFHDSIGLPNKKSMALHPQLYSGLYHRASEIKALDKILYDLKIAAVEAKSQNYRQLVPILGAIKDTLNGKPHLSWWNLFTLSVGHALAPSSNLEEINKEENSYLAQISDILTDIIRNFRSTNSKLLLEIRLAALEIDSRLVELDKIPQDIKDADETLDYISSEFLLLLQELEKVKTAPPQEWNTNSENLSRYVNKTNQLFRILENISESNPNSYQAFLQLPHLKNLQNAIMHLLSECQMGTNEEMINSWQMPQLDDFFELFHHLPTSLMAMKPKDLCSFFNRAEVLFIEDPNLDKKRPKIFSSFELKRYISVLNEEFNKLNTHLRAVIKGIKEDRTIKQDPVGHYRQRLIEENDLHHIAAKVRFKASDYDQNTQIKHPSAVQQDILNRMILLANISQPKELDAVLKSFTDEEKENRYFLSQEVILEQFIRWRKQGIY